MAVNRRNDAARVHRAQVDSFESSNFPPLLRSYELTDRPALLSVVLFLLLPVRGRRLAIHLLLDGTGLLEVQRKRAAIIRWHYFK